MKCITVRYLNQFLVLLVIAALLTACKHKRTSLSGNSKVDLEDFMGSFPDTKLPFQVSDSTFDRDEPDSTLIAYSVFTQFIPDSVLAKHFSKGPAISVYPLGKATAGKKETYLFIKSVTDNRQGLYVLCLDHANKFLASKLLFTSDHAPGTAIAGMDPRFTLYVMHQRKGAGGETLYHKDSYIFSDAGKFMLILTESNEAPVKSRAVINPIDTLPRKHHFSGDYLQDKYNFIAVRDGRDAAHVYLFVHFEKDNGDCKGELKGEAKLIAPSVAQYSASGDPCSVSFTFSPTKVVMKELEGCGNHRDIKCFFDGTFLRQKEPKKKPAKKHHT